jgi:hypothetical protein
MKITNSNYDEHLEKVMKTLSFQAVIEKEGEG